MRAAFLVLCLLVTCGVEATSRGEASPLGRGEPDIVVLARLIRVVQAGRPCGIFFWIGEVEYDVVRVEAGQLEGRAIAVEVGCPVDVWVLPVNGLVRLHLSAKRKDGWPPIAHRSTRADHLYETSEDSIVPSLLDLSRAEADALFSPTGQDDAWTQYGADLALAFAEDRVVRVRLRLPEHWPTGDHPDLGRMGFPHAATPDSGRGALRQWSGKRGHSLGPGIAARREGRTLELWRVAH